MNSNNVFLLGIENKFVTSAGDQNNARKKVGLDANSIVKKIKKIIQKQ